MKEVTNDRENILTIFIFIFLSGNRNSKSRSGKQNWIYGISETKYFDQTSGDNDWNSVIKNWNTNHITTSKVRLNTNTKDTTMMRSTINTWINEYIYIEYIYDDNHVGYKIIMK